MKIDQEPISRNGFLAPWTFRDQGFFESEIAYFHRSWQLFCHKNELNRGRAVRRTWAAGIEVSLTEDETGALQCFYHFEEKPRRGQTREIEGLIFIALEHPEIDIATSFKPFCKELRSHRLSELQPISNLSDKVIDANWKILVEISLDETHVESVHPQLSGVMAGAINYKSNQTLRRWDQPLIRKNAGWALKTYLELSRFLYSTEKNPVWTYFWNFPGMELEFYPEQFAYYQVIPLSPSKTLKRSVNLGLATRNLLKGILRKLNQKIQEQIDQQDIDCVLKRQKVISSLVEFPMIATYGDGLVRKFHETIESSVRFSAK